MNTHFFPPPHPENTSRSLFYLKLLTFAAALLITAPPPPLRALTVDPLTKIWLAFALGLEEDALRKMNNLPAPETPAQAAQLALLKSHALISQKQLYQAQLTLEKALENLPADTIERAVLQHRIALLLAKKEEFSQAHAAIADALSCIPPNHPLQDIFSITGSLLPSICLNNSPCSNTTELLRLYHQLPPSRLRDIVALGILSQPPPTLPPDQLENLTQSLLSHPDPEIAAVARYFTIPTQIPKKKRRHFASQLDSLLQQSTTPAFVRSACALRRAQIYLQEEENESARRLAELAIAYAFLPSQRIAALHTWWKTFPSNCPELPTSATALVEKIAASSGTDVAAAVALNFAEMFSRTAQADFSLQFVLLAITLEPDPERRTALLQTAAHLAFSTNQHNTLSTWLQDPTHKALASPLTHFWQGLVALCNNDLSTARATFADLTQPPASWLGRIGHAALTLAEDPGAVLDPDLLQQLPPLQRPHLLQWLLSIRLLTAAASGQDEIAIATAQQMLSSGPAEAAPLVIAAAKNALLRGYAKLSLHILETIPPALRNQYWHYHHLEAKIANGHIAPSEEPEAWKTLLPQLTQPELLHNARQKRAAACWNIGNYACALSEWTELLQNAPLAPNRRAEITYFSALAARRIGQPQKAAAFLNSLLTHPSSSTPTEVSTAVSCEARLELARLAMENPDLAPDPLPQFETIIATAECPPDTKAIAAILLAEHHLQQQTNNNIAQLEKIQTLLTTVSQNPHVPKDLVFRATVLRGLALLQSGMTQQAEDAFLDVVYGRLSCGAADASRPAEMYWFARAIFEAGNLMEKRKAWTQAVALYRLAENTIPPEADSWRARRERIEREHLLFH